MTYAPAPLAAPWTVRALWPVGALRAVVSVVSLVGTVVFASQAFRRGEALGAARVGRTVPVHLPNLGILYGVIGAGYALAFLVGWILTARALFRARRWAWVLLIVLSAYSVVAALASLVLAQLVRRLPYGAAAAVPGWVTALTLALATVDAAVVVLLTLPVTRAWVRSLPPR